MHEKRYENNPVIGTLGNLNYQILISDTTSTSIWRVRVRYHQRNVHLLKELLTTMVNNFELEATDWGWKLDDEVTTPVITDKEIAPESLAKVIGCN